ncbi:MAG: glycosyltransferase family 4 protein [Hyphomicrobiales bacterium]|nr:glycosyltransferase family 4 protein [Hyphomicrobiales bacterium]MCP5000332.1 glycosyltransferase family 4 protein [Hyphomicrobiales bacterium]
MSDQGSLRILHCFRSPVGGIFRHVRDLAEHHHKAGHQVGILCDSTTGGAHEDALFDDIMPFLDLGLTRTPIRRSVGPSDLIAFNKCANEIRRLQPDIIHGHGAKGGAFARLIGSRLRVSRSRVARLYSPHGGSLHYKSSRLSGKFYFAIERWLGGFTDGLAFVSDYERRAYMKKVGSTSARERLIYNGLSDDEFDDVVPDNSAADFMFIGMMRDLKGPDIFISAFARTEQIVGRPLTAVMIGDGDDKSKYEEMLLQSGRSERVTMRSAMPIAQALKLGKTIVVPSRAESLPYLVLETLAAGRPVIASNVGGIPEICGPDSGALVPPDDADALAKTMALSIQQPDSILQYLPDKADLRNRFSANNMARQMIDFYHECRA